MSTFQKKKKKKVLILSLPEMCRCLEEAALPRYSNLSQTFSQAVSVIWAPRPSHDFRLGLLAVSKVFVRIFLKSLVFRMVHAPTLSRDGSPPSQKAVLLNALHHPVLPYQTPFQPRRTADFLGWICVSGHLGHQNILKLWGDSTLPKLAPWESLLAVHVFFLPHLLGLFLWKFYEWKLETPSARPWHQQGMDPLQRDVDKRP